MKHCPFCAELIQDAAVKCRYCGEWLDPSMRPQWSEPSTVGFLPQAASTSMAPGSWGAGALGGQPVTRGGTRVAPQAPVTRAPSPHAANGHARTSMMGAAMAGDTVLVDEDASRPSAAPVAFLPTSSAYAPERIDDPDSGSWPTHGSGRASVDEVALRMERIKASAAAVRQSAAHDPSSWQPPRLVPTPVYDAGAHEPAATDALPSMAEPAPVLAADSYEFASDDPGTYESFDAYPRAASAGLHRQIPSGAEEPRAGNAEHGGWLAWRPFTVGALALAGITGFFVLFRELAQRTEPPTQVERRALATTMMARSIEPDAAPRSEAPGADVDDVDTRLEHVRELYREGGHAKLEQARATLQGVLEHHRDHPAALLLLAQVQLEQGDAKASLETATRCTSVAADLADCWLTMGVLQQERDDEAAATAAYEKYLELAPDGRYADNVRNLLGRK